MNTMTPEINNDELRAVLLSHPAVADVYIQNNGGVRLGFVVPSSETAPLLSRTCDFEDRLPSRIHLFEPGDALPLFGINKLEAEFLFDEILTRDCYFLSSDLRLPDQPIVVDVGANIGIFAVVAGKLYPGARIIAVEPIKLLCEAIQLNAELHNMDITVANVAAADVTATIELQFYPSNTVMSGIKTGDGSAEMTLRSYLRQQNPGIDEEDINILIKECLVSQVEHCRSERLTDILNAYGVEKVDLLKIDAEHSELLILKGIDESTWLKIDRIAIEVHDVAQRIDVIIRQLEQNGFSVHVIDSELEATGCWMVAGIKTVIDTANLLRPKHIKNEISRNQLISELNTLLQKRCGCSLDRIFVLSQAKLSEKLSM
jgi:FkbM family methyltransferase